jgi:hypothetical protein
VAAQDPAIYRFGTFPSSPKNPPAIHLALIPTYFH